MHVVRSRHWRQRNVTWCFRNFLPETCFSKDYSLFYYSWVNKSDAIDSDSSSIIKVNHLIEWTYLGSKLAFPFVDWFVIFLSFSDSELTITTPEANQRNSSDLTSTPTKQELHIIRESTSNIEIVQTGMDISPTDNDDNQLLLFLMENAEEERNNSSSETASVASDLTRMYVSDEDEKLSLIN